jgi:hypothetical protein
LDLLPWVQKNLLPCKIKESTSERKGELKIKLKKRECEQQKERWRIFLLKKNREWERNSKEEGEEE